MGGPAKDWGVSGIIRAGIIIYHAIECLGVGR